MQKCYYMSNPNDKKFVNLNMSQFNISHIKPKLALLLSAIFVIVTTAVMFSRLAPILSYAEGWCTFFWDSHYISSMLSDGHYEELQKGFLLQFFARRWIGICIMTILVFMLSAASGIIVQKIHKKWKWSGAVVCIIVGISINLYVPGWLANVPVISALSGTNKNVKLMVLSDMVRQREWTSISDYFESNHDVKENYNLLFQNCRNMALAEQEKLGDHLFEFPCVDIRSIYQVDIESPQIAALMSDVFYSMGHIAMSQRYAFEANEKMGNLSPRLLQRLTQTALIYENDALADKYMYMLRKTLFYSDWCDALKDHNSKEYLSDISNKKACIFPDNRFSGIKGLDDDLLQVARNTEKTRQQKVTLQYLGSLYILAGLEDKKDSFLHEFYENNNSLQTVPKYFKK